jgi:2-amino-4-hydroxy-6-hydroxymethyldihydropteridine diphosphokinase
MTKVHINIGSNVNKEKNIQTALTMLEEIFGTVQKSNIYTSAAVGFEGDDFFNVGVNITTDLQPQELVCVLRDIEDKIGRDRTSAKFSDRVIDLDIVFFGDKIIPELNIPRDDILKYQFVLTPFMELTNL